MDSSNWAKRVYKSMDTIERDISHDSSMHTLLSLHIELDDVRQKLIKSIQNRMNNIHNIIDDSGSVAQFDLLSRGVSSHI